MLLHKIVQSTQHSLSLATDERGLQGEQTPRRRSPPRLADEGARPKIAAAPSILTTLDGPCVRSKAYNHGAFSRSHDHNINIVVSCFNETLVPVTQAGRLPPLTTARLAVKKPTKHRQPTSACSRNRAYNSGSTHLQSSRQNKVGVFVLEHQVGHLQ